MKSYLQYVSAYRTLLEQGREISAVHVLPVPPPAPDAPAVLLFSPHPDDECVTGLLPLRLMREAGMRVINVPVTFGSNRSRQATRAAELKNACAYLGFQCLGKTALRPASCCQPLEKADVAELLKTERPSVVFVPHSKDWNLRHISTHLLVMNALKAMPPDFTCAIIETEFWGAMENPNLMVEGDAQTVADLVAALSLHTGEVARNPYHLMLPAWMMDNVRRGGEVVLGQGGEAPDFTFATLYRLTRWQDGAQQDVFKGGRAVPSAENAGEFLK